YGISVPRKYQTTRSSISDALAGMQWEDSKGGMHIYKVKGWDYAGLVETFQRGINRIRETHTPAILHVQEVTQPQGHSTSGSHQREYSTERLVREKQQDCTTRMRQFIIDSGIAKDEELKEIEITAREDARSAKQMAWHAFITPP